MLALKLAPPTQKTLKRRVITRTLEVVSKAHQDLNEHHIDVIDQGFEVIYVQLCFHCAIDWDM